MALTDLIPIDGQVLDLAEDFNISDTSFRVLGRFENTAGSTDDDKYGSGLGKQFLAFSPFSGTGWEGAYAVFAGEPTLVSGTTNTYEYSVANGALSTFTRGLKTKNTSVPPTGASANEKKHLGQRTKVALVVNGAIIANTITLLTTSIAAAADNAIPFTLFAPTQSAVVGDGREYWQVPSVLNGWNISSVEIWTVTAGTTGTATYDIYNVTNGASIFSTQPTIDSGETSTDTAATPAVINAAQDHLTAGDIIRFDVDAVHTTPSKGDRVIIYVNNPS